jgi:hypothetical protein
MSDSNTSGRPQRLKHPALGRLDHRPPPGPEPLRCGLCGIALAAEDQANVLLPRSRPAGGQQLFPVRCHEDCKDFFLASRAGPEERESRMRDTVLQ